MKKPAISKRLLVNPNTLIDCSVKLEQIENWHYLMQLGSKSKLTKDQKE